MIFYRAVGPCNRTVLFGGKNAPLDKSDRRLRPLPFPTGRATFSEIQRVYDVLSNIEIYGNIFFNTQYEAFHVNSPSVAQNSAVFGSCSN